LWIYKDYGSFSK